MFVHKVALNVQNWLGSDLISHYLLCITATGSKVALNVFNNSYPSGSYSYHMKLIEVSYEGQFDS